MFFDKYRSFTIIEMESIELINSKKNSLERAITIINNEQTLFKYIMIGYYNIIKKLLNYVYIHDIYCKNFCVNNFKIKDKEHWYISNKPVNLIILDNCIYINNFKIPYEYIILFFNKTDMIYLKIFGNIVNENNKINLELSSDFIEILFNYTNSTHIINCIKTNMFYHIKYNKISEVAIEYFLKTNKDC